MHSNQVRQDRRFVRLTTNTISRGFTLVELMIVVTIIAIILAIAVPNYNEYVLKSKLSEASSHLSTLQIKMEQFYQDNRSYTRGGAACTGGSTCGICPPTDAKYFTFTCAPGGDGQTFTYTATGSAATAGFVFTVKETGAKETQLPSGTTVSCWATNASGGC